MKQIDKSTAVFSGLWKILDTFASKGISTVVSIVLARLLFPEDYGIIALTNIFINFSGILVQNGIGTAVIRAKKAEDEEYSNALFISLLTAGVLYLIFFAAAPFIASYYEEPQLVSVLRVQMISLFICALGTVQMAIVTRQCRFKVLCMTNVIATVLAGIVGIVLAYMGFGVWSLVVHTLVRDALGNILLVLLVRWKLVFKISLSKIRALVSFGFGVLTATILDFVGNNIFSVTIGKRYSVTDLGYYSKGGQLPELVGLHTFGAISSVLLPTLAQRQDDREAMKRVVKKTCEVASYVMFPTMVGLALVATRLVPVLFTEKWNPCVPILWASCISFGVNPFRNINMQLIYADGKSSMAVKIEIVRCALQIMLLILGTTIFSWNIYGLAFSLSGIALFIAVITQGYAQKRLKYTYWEWIRDILPAVLLTVAMGAVVLLVGLLPFSDFWVLVLQVLSGAATYLLLSFIFKIKTFFELVEIIFKRKGQKP